MLINSKGSWMKNLWLNSYYILDITLSLMKWEKWSKKPSNLAECWKKLIVPISKSHAAGIRMEEKRKAPWDIGLIFMKTFIWTLIIHLSLLTTLADFTISMKMLFPQCLWFETYTVQLFHHGLFYLAIFIQIASRPHIFSQLSSSFLMITSEWYSMVLTYHHFKNTFIHWSITALPLHFSNHE